MTKEQKFYDALRDVFVGAKVEGESGYINLMRIKSRYYQNGVFPRLQHDIDTALVPFPEFREELFDKLYTFFSRYFSESGSIYFRHTPLHQNVYERVYTDDKDVMLFWKTHMLYYVKTDRLFRSLEVELDGVKFFFDVSTLEHKRANEKREIVYEFKEKRKDGTLVFTVTYSEKGRKTKLDDILRELKKQGVNLASIEVLERAFRVFERQSEVDYFINKNAKAFLEEQFNLWLYQYIFSGESAWTETRIKQLQVLKEIAYKIIAFISQFEDELVKIWNKPKFVLNSNYIITLDHIAERDMGLLERLLAHENIGAQVAEWRALGMVAEDVGATGRSPLLPDDLFETDLLGTRLSAKYRTLPLDTRYFKDCELDILGLFDDLDQALDGWLIKSENYQALNTMLPKFRERVQCIYIDPPYNTGSDEFIYRDQFRHSSWLTMMENRLALAREWMSMYEGSIYISIDDNEYTGLRQVTDRIFDTDNLIATVIWQKIFAPKNTAKYFSEDHDYILVFARDKAKWAPYLLPRSAEAEARYTNPDNDPRGPWTSSDLTARNYYSEGTYEVVSPGGKVFTPAIGTYWRVSKENFERLDREGRIWWGPDGTNMPRLKRFFSEVKPGVVPQTLWKHEDVGNTQEAKKELLATVRFERTEDVLNTVKPTRLLRRIFEISTSSETPGFILDFFAGSGTTAHAVINLNRQDGGRRKYILVEMADYFDTVLLPRIKKVVFCENWRDGKAAGGQGISHFVKYYQLEQYEEALRRARYDDADLFDNPYEDPYNQYVFLRDLKLLEALEVDLEQNRVQVDLSRLYPNIDVAETLSNLRGKWIKRVTPDRVEFEDGETVDLRHLDYRLIKPLIWW